MANVLDESEEPTPNLFDDGHSESDVGGEDEKFSSLNDHHGTSQDAGDSPELSYVADGVRFKGLRNQARSPKNARFAHSLPQCLSLSL